MIAVLLPGLKPQDISVKVAAGRLTIHGWLRGPRRPARDVALAEWAAGPYYREVELPAPVNGALANATYGNGVLVLVLPKLEPGQPSVDTKFRLQADRPPHGLRVGHTGRQQYPTSTEAYQRNRAELARHGVGWARAHDHRLGVSIGAQAVGRETRET